MKTASGINTLIWGFFINVCVFVVSFLFFYYIRKVRGDRCRNGPSIGPIPPGMPHPEADSHLYTPLDYDEDDENCSAGDREAAEDRWIRNGGSKSSTTTEMALKNSNPWASSTNRDNRDRSSLGFMTVLWNISVDQFYSKDVQFYLVFIKMCAAITSTLSVLGISLILPLNLSVSRDSPDTLLQRVFTIHVGVSTGVIWTFYAIVWVFMIIVYSFLFIASRYLRKHDVYHASEQFLPEKFALMVSGISKTVTTATSLKKHFESVMPNKVIMAHVVLDYSDLIAAKKKLYAYREELEKSMGDDSNRIRPFLWDPDRRPLLMDTERRPSIGHKPEEVEIVHDVPPHSIVRTTSRRFWRKGSDVNQLEAQFILQRSFVARVASLVPLYGTGLGFVCFSSTSAASQCVSDPRIVKENADWEISRAPPPGDIIWSNIHVSPMQCFFRSLFANLIVFLISLVLTSTAILANWFIPLCEEVLHKADISVLRVSGWSAPLNLFLINSVVLPFCVFYAGVFASHWRQCSFVAAILHGNAIFLILNSFILPVIGSSSVGTLIAKMHDTQFQQWNIVMSVLIAKQTGDFAIRYLLNACFLSSAGQLLQVPQILYNTFCWIMDWPAHTWYFDFGYHYAFCVSIFTMAFVLSIFLPPLLPLAALFFLLKYWTDKYNFAFGVWKIRVHSEGDVTRTALNYILFAVTFMQFVMSGYFLHLGIENDKYLTFAGTLLFLTSSLGAVLQLGHCVNMGAFAQEWRPGVAQMDRRLKPEEVKRLKSAYTHPCDTHRIRETSRDNVESVISSSGIA